MEKVVSQLRGVPPGSVQALVCTDVLDTLARIEVDLREAPDTRFVSVGWTESSRVHDGIHGVLDEFADLALARWPEWPDVEAQVPPERVRVIANEDVTPARKGVNRTWLQRAVALCEHGRKPLPRGFADEVHADGLTRALGANDLIVGLVLESREHGAEHLLAFARTAEWIALQTDARVAVLIPVEHRNERSLDSIMYGSIVLSAPEVPARYVGGDRPANVVSPPLIGQPHPGSEGEKLLAEALGRDPELASLFAFNQPVDTERHERFLVDVVWSGGKLVVEVDGYRWHSTETNFRQDRYRDYRLMTVGYRVLRLPHDEVIHDVALQVDKIRDMVRFIRQKDNVS